MTAEIGTLTQQKKQVLSGQIGDPREIRVWEAEDAPPGSTSESLLVFERGIPVRVAKPTHYTHLADGRVVSTFGGGTVYSEAVTDEQTGKVSEKLTKITANYPA
jgi:hypothetical protein